jgi:hypothetical protein
MIKVVAENSVVPRTQTIIRRNPMQKKSTLLFVSIFVLLFIGLSDYGYGCHREVDGVRILHGKVEDCDDRTVESGDRYNVKVDGDLSSDQTFVGRDGGGRNKPVQVYFQFVDLIDTDDLTSFFSDLSLFDGDGADCFGAAPVEGNVSSIRITQDKDGLAYVTYWFTGHGRNPADPANPTEITYLLEMFDGVFSGDPWRPDHMTTVTFSNDLQSSWEISINGNNPIACTDIGVFTVDQDQTIVVENTTE